MKKRRHEQRADCQKPRAGLPMLGSCWLSTHLQFDEVLTSELPGRSGWHSDVGKLLKQRQGSDSK